jgi:hypothetical protein
MNALFDEGWRVLWIFSVYGWMDGVVMVVTILFAYSHVMQFWSPCNEHVLKFDAILLNVVNA